MIYVFVIVLVVKLVELVLGDLNYVFFVGFGFEVNDINLCFVCCYWQCKGKFDKQIVISCCNVYYGLIMVGMSFGGMGGMYVQGGIIQGIYYINQFNWWVEGGDMLFEDFGLVCV